MADEKKATGHEEQAPPAGPSGSKAPPVPKAEQQPVQLGIENLDAPASDKKAEKSGPDHAAPVAESKDGPKIPDGKVIDITGKVAPGAEVPAPSEDKKAAKAAPEKTGQDAPAKKGKTKAGPEKADKAPTPRKGAKGKDTGDKGKPVKGQRDKVSQGKVAPEQPAAGGGSGPAAPPAPEAPAPAEPTSPPRPVEEGKLIYLKLSELHPFHTFRAHPFKVRDDAKMQETVASIKLNGVMVPGLARPEKAGNGYELIAGHRRHRGSELAGLTEMPFIVREMTDHEAVQAMKDSNKQREQTLPSELAALLDLEVEDIKHQGTRLKGVAEGDIGKRSVEIVGEAHDMNYKKVMRYLRLNSLVPELLDKVDEKKMGFMPAVELSFIRPKNQRLIAVSIDGEQASPSVAQAKRLRELDKAGKLTGDIIDGILSEEKKEVDRVIITTDELNKYFGKEVTPRQMKDQIMALLDDWKEKQPPALDKPQQDR